MKRTRQTDFPVLTAVNRRSRPMWRSIHAAMAWQIDIGRLAAGTRVPSTRTLAQRLRLSRNTIALAFDCLIADGYLRGRVGDGTYVQPHVERGSTPIWRRRRTWIQDPDGLRLWVTFSSPRR